MGMLDNIITALVKREIRYKLSYLTKDYIDEVITKIVTKELHKLCDENKLKEKITEQLNKEFDIKDLVRSTEFRTLSTLREYVSKATQDQFKLETGEYFYQALVRLVNNKTDV